MPVESLMNPAPVLIADWIGRVACWVLARVARASICPFRTDLTLPGAPPVAPPAETADGMIVIAHDAPPAPAPPSDGNHIRPIGYSKILLKCSACE